MASQNTALKELLLGSGSGQLNLSAVRARAEELKRSLDQIIQGLQFAADRVQWPDVLDRFAVINVQYQHLLDALRPLLRQFAAYPRSVNQTNAPILPIMLATKLLPEMEGEEAELLQELEAERRRRGGEGQAAAAAQLSMAEQFAWVQDQEQQLNHLIDQLAREEGSPLGERRRKEVQAAAAKAAAATAAPATRPPAPAARQPQQGGPPRGPGAPDPLLAAVTFGTGLS
ncbi:hypothetical protein CHLNCDRAFT_142742 [Chlorella variabilis]|uniref:Mediator of RNA polymerase II transcription subunit 8 n=1 Tax=Chlorella variabilis TaxID=554065 RepID=E1Z8M5_CHLVA|nr:hypothetical protein CHLNCDRAFT_142742 [Chlorella variabilis]EFN57634.1 hypothetical protein CHLNCDRAFT_142742 [Chlorella variabilis]|eukprot:XP_005849736.1 hypothetical protein CHLNCDRAFT_142742 [Chlorella variabilis]